MSLAPKRKPLLDLIKAAKIRTRLIKYMKIIFEDVDFLVTPTCGQTPEPIHEGDSVCKFSSQSDGALEQINCYEVPSFVFKVVHLT